MLRVLIFTLFLGSLGCVDPIPLAEFSQKKPDKVNVYGLMDDKGTSSVWLSRSIDFFDGDRLPPPIRNADVNLVDEGGHIYPYQEVEAGARSYYELRDFKPEFNRGYALSIVLPGGDSLASTFQYLRSGSEIVSTRVEYVDGRSINELGNEVDSKYWNVYVSHRDVSAFEGFFTWRWRGTYRFRTEPEGGPISFCYSNEYDDVFRLNSRDKSTDVESLIARIAMETKKVEFTYQLDISQYYFDDPVIYNYWELINTQQTSAGSIFDPLPAPIPGNITNLSRPPVKVNGIFWVASEQRTLLHIDRADIPGAIPVFFTDRPCSMFPFTTDIQPDYYPNFEDTGG